MSARNYAQTLSAGQSIRLPAGRYFFVKTAAAALNISTIGNPGSPVQFVGIGAGSKFGPVPEGQGWSLLQVTSAVAQAIEIIISDDANFEVASTVTVSGAVAVIETPCSTFTDQMADTSLAIATQTTFPQDLTRKRLTIGVLSTSNNSVRVSGSGGAARGIEIQPGMTYTFNTTAQLVVRNDDTMGTGANAVYYVEYET